MRRVVAVLLCLLTPLVLVGLPASAAAIYDYDASASGVAELHRGRSLEAADRPGLLPSYDLTGRRGGYDSTANLVRTSARLGVGSLAPLSTLDDFAGVREASRYLQEAGVPRSVRKEVLESFERGTIRVQTAGADTYGLRFFGGESDALGRYLSPTLPATRSSLALPPGNAMSGIAQFQIRPGATYFTGRVGPNFGYPGGGVQQFVPNLGDLIQL